MVYFRFLSIQKATIPTTTATATAAIMTISVVISSSVGVVSIDFVDANTEVGWALGSISLASPKQYMFQSKDPT